MSDDLLIRYEIRYGKWGAYYYDKRLQRDLTLQEVTDLLNELNEIKLERLGEALGGPGR